MTSQSRPRTLVVGAGLSGLTALKNLLEEGLDAFAFERADVIGGLWTFSEDETRTTVTEVTKPYGSKEKMMYTDFSFPDDTPSIISHTDMSKYLHDYAAHYNLLPLIKLNTRVHLIVPLSESGDSWKIVYSKKDGPKEEIFVDKVVISTGVRIFPKMPKIEGLELFAGRVKHSQNVKRFKHYDNDNVVVLGIGPTGTEIATGLVGHAKKIYISHRRGKFVLPRMHKGRPFDHNISRRKSYIAYILRTYLAPVTASLGYLGLQWVQRSTWKTLDPAWGLTPAPPIPSSGVVMSDTLIPHLRSGNIQSVPSIARITGPSSVELTDGRVLEDIDTLIFATGYLPDFSIIPFHEHHRLSPLLYKGILSQKYPRSLAFVTFGSAVPAGCSLWGDLASMYVAQVFSGHIELPTAEEMKKEVDNHVKRLEGIERKFGTIAGYDAHEVWAITNFLADATGCGLERVRWGWEGWKFWWHEPRLSEWLMKGIEMPPMYRLFEGGRRKAWDGAFDAIKQVNES